MAGSYCKIFRATRMFRCNRIETEYALRVVDKVVEAAVPSRNESKVAVVGASGYAGEELVRLLLGHPQANLVAATSRQFTGKTLAQIFPRFSHDEKARQLRFAEFEPAQLAQMAEIIFLALPHGVSAEIAKSLVDLGVRVIDLSADFRIRDPNVYKEFYGIDHRAPELLGEAVYGLPEIYREKIRGAKLVACPGCYPTSILLPLLPLIRERIVERRSIIATSLSGVTGAGRKVEADYLFAECNESVRPYGVPKHRHLSEIEQELSILAVEKITVQFTPHLVPVNRGILSTIYVDLNRNNDLGVIDSFYEKAYRDEPFVRLLGEHRLPDTKEVIGTNFIDIAWRIDPRTRRLIVMSAIDNLIKGTSGQAVQCFNLMRAYRETTGLL
jgi:N-acetyl-gamma-glutamyl-phosphate reductase